MDDKYFAHAVRYPLTVDRFSFFKKMLPMRFWVVDLYRRDFENRGISLIKIDVNLGLYRAGVCDTPLQYWGLSSE
ncbi:Uncharacterised protein [Sphingobacterium mizutaii]|uniref:Uncharacterized protein n=1 Tax=Sphingobacterium mizutaii TaxID=1010 RepID=A0AAJ5C118_9SPHI|nr:hypothetical protein SAMN05192578_102171 [Sphingobacterium mizutaii]SNV53440.1 Uncharacterised protein [Sphingobacterium mizutaii]